MRLLVAAAVLLLGLFARPAAGADSFDVVDAFQKDGAFSLIIVPHSWNGAFIVYAHGYDADYRDIKPYPSDITPANIGSKLSGADLILQIPLGLGYAVGTTTYRSVGWAVADAWRDVDNVRRRFRKRVGKPTFTYVWGHSEGGMVTQTVIEKRPHDYDGALPMCALGAGGRRNLNGAWDLRAAYEYTCAGVPDAGFRCNVCTDGTSRCLADADCPSGQTCGDLEASYPPEWGLTPECTEFVLKKAGDPKPEPRFVDFVARHVIACFGAGSPTPEQQARRDLFLRGTQIPPSFLVTDLFFASVALGEIRNRRTGGGVPWSNDGVTYDSPALTPVELAAFNAGVARATNDPAAMEYLRRNYEERGLHAEQDRDAARARRRAGDSAERGEVPGGLRRGEARRPARAALHADRWALRLHGGRARRGADVALRVGGARAEADRRERAGDVRPGGAAGRRPVPHPGRRPGRVRRARRRAAAEGALAPGSRVPGRSRGLPGRRVLLAAHRSLHGEVRTAQT